MVCEIDLPRQQRSAQALAPAMSAALAEAGWRAQDIQLVAVTQGPGSFTGLRVGVASAKAFAYAVGAEVIGVNTLEAIAAQAPLGCGETWAILDAHRRQLFVARFRLHETELPEETVPTSVRDIDAWLAEYSPSQFVAGPGVSRIAARLPVGAKVVDPTIATPRASTVGLVALRRFTQGERHDLWSFVPIYYRPSAAEEKHQDGAEGSAA